mgnify:FL=1
MSLAQVAKYGCKSMKNYIFHLIDGPDVTSTFVVCPRDYASAGYFMNHGTTKKQINISASIAIDKNGPIIIMRAIRDIKYG